VRVPRSEENARVSPQEVNADRVCVVGRPI
jgi:hypothetical protein